MKPRLIATDIDGTIAGRDGKISDRTRAALAMAEDAGAVLVLVTGRPPRWIHAIAEQTGHRGLVVCANGALLYDLHDESVLESHLLTPEAIRSVCLAVRQALPEVSFAVDYGREFVREPAYRPRWETGARLASLEQICSTPAAKLLIHHSTIGPDELLAQVVDAAGGLAEFTHSSNHGLIEVSAPGVSKASGLAHVADMHGVAPAEVLAFGDMPNDLPMLAWAGTAYAMANAHPAVIAAVPLRAPSVDEDGVAVVLEHIFG